MIHRDVSLRFLTIQFMNFFEKNEFSSDKNGEGPGIPSPARKEGKSGLCLAQVKKRKSDNHKWKRAVISYVVYSLLKG